MPVISGGGGTPFNGGTITDDLLVNAALGVSSTNAPLAELDSGHAGADFASALRVRNGDGTIILDLDTGGELGLSAGAAGAAILYIADHTGALIFRVNDDGSLQGKTGGALTFNL